MKHIYSLLIITIFAISCSSCKKSTPDPVSQLPPETQTGANTFGCLINGVAFKPKGSLFGPPSLQCAYQYLNGGYYFQLGASDDLHSISVGTDSLKIKENTTYQLLSFNNAGVASGQYNYYGGTIIPPVHTNPLYPGSLSITKYDSINQIVSGTFWFNVVYNNDTVRITNGRFDMHYTL
ncbi:MAG: hypothetical protein JST29_11090 [Bacteroidetes bacterium]|nr:hypothetical protein [Bacteroidota bacterium]